MTNIVKVNKSNYGISYILRCLNCSKEFKVKKSEYDRGHKQFCSMKCRSENGTEKIKCLVCGNIFIVRKSQEAKYCSRKCAVVICKRQKTLEHRKKISIAHIGIKPSLKTKKLLSEKKIKFYEENPEKHPNRIMAKKGFISKPQQKMYKLIKNVYSTAEIEYPVKTKIGTKYIDVAIPELKIAIEYDGEYWHKGNEKQDKIRQKAIEQQGWEVLRFDKNNYKNCLEKINTYKTIKERKMI